MNSQLHVFLQKLCMNGKLSWNDFESIRSLSSALLITYGAPASSPTDDSAQLIELGLSGRLISITEAAGISTMGELVRADPRELVGDRRGARQLIALLQLTLASHGRYFGDRT